MAKKYPAARKRYRVYAPAVRQLASDVMYLKGLVNAEPKNHFFLANNNVDYTGAMLSTCEVPQGDGSGNRDGNRILPRYYNLNGRIWLGSGFTGVAVGVRVVVFKWWGESPNAVGVAPVPSDILESALISTQNACDAFLDPAITGSKRDRNRRVEVLRNFYKSLSVNGDPCLDIHEVIEMNGKGKTNKEHMEFYTTTTNPPTSGGIFVLIITSSATATDVGYHIKSKLTYYDN